MSPSRSMPCLDFECCHKIARHDARTPFGIFLTYFNFILIIIHASKTYFEVLTRSITNFLESKHQPLTKFWMNRRCDIFLLFQHIFSNTIFISFQTKFIEKYYYTLVLNLKNESISLWLIYFWMKVSTKIPHTPRATNTRINLVPFTTNMSLL